MPDGSKNLDFLVRRDDLRKHRFEPAADFDDVSLGSGQVLLRVDAFALTSNNVSYAVAGDALSYWRFFPAPEGWGRIPVWGFGEVVRSRQDTVTEGERLFGYLPMSTHLVLQPDASTPRGFMEAAPQRAGLPAVYNHYVRVASDPAYEARYEDQQMLLWPLFATSFLLDDFIAENRFFGARRLVLSSASSKTALGLAFLLSRRRPSQCEVVGLTSPRHVGFVEGLGCYDRVLPYAEVASLPRDEPAVLVDMAGNGSVTTAFHQHLAERVRYSCVVGATHWEEGGRPKELPGAAPTFFFAPTRAQKRAQEWGPGGLEAKLGQAWRQFVPATREWLRVVHGRGPEAVERVYATVLEGRSRPQDGHVLSLAP